VQLGIAVMEASMWKEVGRAACWIGLDCAALGLSCPKLDSSMRSRDDFSTPSCRYWNTDHYLVLRKLH
jgi:uncharacterized ferredoxin-like protein